jgi:hypothetical protein
MAKKNTGDVSSKWGNTRTEKRTELRGMVSVAPGGLKHSAEIHIVDHDGRSCMYEMTLPGGRYMKRLGMRSIAEAREESELVARALLAIFVEATPVAGPAQPA